MECKISTDEHRIVVEGRLGLGSFRRLLATIHNRTVKKGFQELLFDFSGCVAAYPGPMALLSVQCMRLRHDGVDVGLIPPAKDSLQRHFFNANWAHLIDPGRFDVSRFRGYRQVPTTSFQTPHEQFTVVNRMADAVLCSMPELDRTDLKAIEWVINEITDNVLVHSYSPVGGVVHLSNYAKNNRVELVVADPGIGIPASIREGHPEYRYDPEALDIAIREGVTRDKAIGQGNGLYGSLRIAEKSHGYFHIHSGYARLSYENDELRVSREQIPVVGSLVVVAIDCAYTEALTEALRIGDGDGQPLDYVTTHYDAEPDDDIHIVMKDEVASFGSRIAGEPLRTKLGNLARMTSGRIVVDCRDIPIVSSSFADEVFGKLFVDMGSTTFSSRFQFINLDPLVKALVDKAISQRMKG